MITKIISIDLKAGERPPNGILPRPPPKSWDDRLTEDEKQIIQKHVPDMRKASLPENAAIKNIVEVQEILGRFGADLVAPLREKYLEAVRLNEANEVTFKKVVAENERYEARIRDLESELRQARELRGTYESKTITELTKKLENREAEVLRLLAVVNSGLVVIKELEAEREGHKAALAAYEREKRELMAAAVLTASAIQYAAKHLTEARDNMEDRYGGKPGAFLAAIQADIVAALKALPTTTP